MRADGMNKARIATIRHHSGTVNVLLKPPIEHMQRFWERQIFYEQAMLGYIRGRNRGGVFVDVGSAIGNHTLFFLAFCDADLVVSIEPVKSSIEHQRENLALNGLEHRALLLNLALGQEHRRANMERFGPNLGQFRISEGEDVQVVTLDSVVQARDIHGISLLKIDVEGWELEVLKGGIETLQEQHPAIFVEILRPGGRAEILALLEPLGYTPGLRWSRMFEFVCP